MLSFVVQRKFPRIIYLIFLISIIFFSNVECLLKKANQTVKFKKGDTNGGYGLNFTPPNYKNVIVWLHGLCSSAVEWERFVLLVNKKDFLPNTKWIIPTSKYRKIAAIYGNECPAWFNITSFSPAENIEDVDGILESATRIRNIIKSEIDSGIDQSRIFLIGFSQGSAMALITSMIMRDITIGGVIGVSGWIPMIDHLSLGKDSPLNNEIFDFNVSDKKKQNTRVYIFHGSKDKLIPFYVFLQTSIFMSTELEIQNINQRMYHNIGHTITAMQGIHIMYEISKMIDSENIHMELTTVQLSTLSNSSYSMILKVTDPADCNYTYYKFMPCNPSQQGQLICKNSDCNCTEMLYFYEKSKFLENLNHRDFGQNKYPYAIIQAIPSENNKRSSNKEDKSQDFELTNIKMSDKDSEGKTDNYVSGNDTNQAIVDEDDENENSHTSLRRRNSSSNSIGQRYLTSINDGLSDFSSIVDYDSKLYISLRGNGSEDIESNSDEHLDKQEQDQEDQVEHLEENEVKQNEERKREQEKNGKGKGEEEEERGAGDREEEEQEVNVTSTLVSPVDRIINDELNTSNKISSAKISHYSRTPVKIRHYIASDKDNSKEGQSMDNMGGGGEEVFKIEKYIDSLYNKSRESVNGGNNNTNINGSEVGN
ncbi:Phospholipase/Carboxylesterase [Cryptosporidium meleagridis]